MDNSPIIGRRDESSLLEQDLKAAAAGKGKIVLLAGEAGMGKTRLANHAGENSNLTFLGAAANETATPPYGPFIDIFRNYLRNHPHGFDKLGPLKPYLAQLLPEINHSTNGEDHNTLLEAIRVAIETIAAQSPTLLFIDDLQWADHATLDLLPKLAEPIKDLPLLLLLAYRSDEIPRGHPVRRIRNDLRRANHLNEINIEPLTPNETRELSEQLLQSTVSPSLSQALYYKTQGVPFFIEELTAAMNENGHLQTDGQIIDLVSPENIPLPETVRDAILIRFDKLSPQTKEYLEIASVVGQQFSFELLSGLIEHERVDDAIQHGFLIKSTSDLGQFRHALTREAIYNEISWSRARDLHRKIAAYLEDINA
ncbi:MAG: AAA family ATPase, partial [Anaerolineae bacterium]|nr:AAA family ATPase [Anaerolineae bacterium]